MRTPPRVPWARGWTPALLLLCWGCATSTSDLPVVAPAVDAPERFLVGGAAGEEPVDPRPGEGCRSPLVDPRDGARLAMVRSSGGVGDYEAPPGRYGVGPDRLLRVECATGRPLGVVRR